MSAIFAAAVWKLVETKLWSGAAKRLSGIPVERALTALPSRLLLSRPETTLFHNSFAFSSHVWSYVLIFADLVMSNPAFGPTVGLLGSLAYGAVLWLEGISPLHGFYMTAVTWGLLYALTLVEPPPSEESVPIVSRGTAGATLNVSHATSISGAGGASISVTAPKAVDTVHGILRPGKQLDISAVLWGLVCICGAAQLLFFKPLAGYIFPGFTMNLGISSWSMWALPLSLSPASITALTGKIQRGTSTFAHPVFLLVLFPWIVSFVIGWFWRLCDKVWKGDAVVQGGINKLPDRALRTSVDKVSAKAKEHVQKKLEELSGRSSGAGGGDGGAVAAAG